jgi:hypothetical protein
MKLEDKEDHSQKEIAQMTKKIIERYQIPNYLQAKQLAIDLYQNGIHLDKFQEKYYKGLFNLDEIALYLYQKRINESKIIPLQSKISKEKKPENSNIKKIDNQSKIIPYQLKLNRNTKTYPKY